MKLLKEPYGYGGHDVPLVRLEAPNGLVKDPTEALLGLSCYPPAISKIISCLEHGSVYECCMRKSVAQQCLESEALKNVGIQFTVITKDTYARPGVGS
jgi:hypothetical protein